MAAAHLGAPNELLGTRDIVCHAARAGARWGARQGLVSGATPSGSLTLYIAPRRELEAFQATGHHTGLCAAVVEQKVEPAVANSSRWDVERVDEPHRRVGGGRRVTERVAGLLAPDTRGSNPQDWQAMIRAAELCTTYTCAMPRDGTPLGT